MILKTIVFGFLLSINNVQAKESENIFSHLKKSLETEKTIPEQKINKPLINEGKSRIGDPKDYEVESTEIKNNHKSLSNLIFEGSIFKIVISILCFLVLIDCIRGFLKQESNSPFKIIPMFFAGYYMIFPSSLLSSISFLWG